MRTLNIPRALWLLVAAYLVVSTLGFCLYLIIGAVMGHSPWAEVDVRDNLAYQRTATVLPLLNLTVWTVAARSYFTRARRSAPAWPLALAWLVIAVTVDYVAFVIPDHALAVDARGFYLEQGPWIYLTYAAIVVAAYLGRRWVTTDSESSTREGVT